MLYLDTSALLKRYVSEEGTDLVLELMAQDGEWVASAVARTEAEITLCHVDLEPDARDSQRNRLRDDWDRFRVVPLDAACLASAADIGCSARVRTLDALHLAAASRLPRPFVFVTFDDRQAQAAQALSFDVAGAKV